MTEPDWLKAKEAELMLEFVADRLTPRQWRFLSGGLARRVWELLPEGPLRGAIDWVELQEGNALDAAGRADWRARVEAETEAAAARAEAEMREVVRPADPDSGTAPPGTGPDPDDLPPSRVLFAAASRHAANAVAVVATAARSAAQAVGDVLLPPGEDSFAAVQGQVQEALSRKADASQAANNALKLKALGDEFADAYNPKTVRLDRSKAMAHVGRIEEATAGGADLAERTVRRHVARLLHEVVGNPFKPVRFDAAWRTSDAAALARGIFADRAFDRLPILADALLDADCDEEAILRHCRGTELHLKESKESQPHARGCWVVELVLNRWGPLPAPRKSKAKKPARPAWLDVDFDEPSLRGDADLA